MSRDSTFRRALLVFVVALGSKALAAGERSLSPGLTWQKPASSAMLQYRVLKIIENEQRRHPLPKEELVFAPTCILKATTSDFFEISDLQAKREVATVGIRPDLSLPARNLNDVFNVLRLTRWGNAVMKKFFPKFGFDIKIDQFTEDMKEVERQRGRRAAAVYDVDTKTIFVNRSEQIGTVAPILLHEIVHSLDQDFTRSVERERQLWSEFDRDINAILRDVAVRARKQPDDLEQHDFAPEELARMRRMKSVIEEFRDVRVYRAERVAYDMYYNVLVELADLFPKYYKNGPLARTNVRPYDDEELIRTEGLDPDVIDKFKRGLCKTRP